MMHEYILCLRLDCRKFLRKISVPIWLNKDKVNGSKLLLHRFSCGRLSVNPEMAAYQTPLSLGFSRQEHWSGLPFPSPMLESEVAQSCPTPSDPMDHSPLGSSIHGIFQARVLGWGAIVLSGQ